jgi:hypothetical protein
MGPFVTAGRPRKDGREVFIGRDHSDRHHTDHRQRRTPSMIRSGYSSRTASGDGELRGQAMSIMYVRCESVFGHYACLVCWRSCTQIIRICLTLGEAIYVSACAR